MKQLKDEPLEGEALRNKIFDEIPIICDEFGIDYTGNTINPRQWALVIQELNARFIRHNRIALRDSHTQYNEYNQDKVEYLYNIYYLITSIYKQECSLYLFAKLSGINKDTFYEWASSGRSDLHKRIMQDDEQSLEQMLQDPRLNPMKILPSLNKKHGWNLPGVSKEVKQTALDVGRLPELSENGAILGLPDGSEDV